MPLMKGLGMNAPPAGVWLLTRLRQLAWLAGDDVGRLAVCPAVAVHALRVRMKKLGALLGLGETEGNSGQLDAIMRRCRRLKNGFGRQRDDEVLRKLSLDLFGESGVWSSKRLVGDWSAVRARREVELLVRSLDRLDLSGLSWETLLENYDRSYRKACRAMWRCEVGDEAAVFHAWRKRVKKLFFQSLALHGLRGARKRIRRSKRLGRHLGREHDLALLALRIPADRTGRARRERVEKKRLKLHAKLLKEGGKLFPG
jgi:hypothetical protein